MGWLRRARSYLGGVSANAFEEGWVVDIQGIAKKAQREDREGKTVARPKRISIEQSGESLIVVFCKWRNT